ncbi:hypothetical protein [Nocardia australiensis]|uniref:hypothetical protein n=1 Tax=Nocardia australiensis TaxID=2887191 RepID=UPI001D13AC3E|nr:hypothetical protein [Nocardia australiensis]
MRGSRASALSAAKTLIPTSPSVVQGTQPISALPAEPGRALVRRTTKTACVYNSITVEDHPPSPAASRGRVGLATDPGSGLGNGPYIHE